MSNSAWTDSKSKRDILKLHDSCGKVIVNVKN